MTIKMTNKARQAARDLAVTYSSYNEAISNNSDSSIKIWGGMLLESQDETGIELIESKLLKLIISRS